MIRVFHLVQRANTALFRAADRRLERQHAITATQLGLLLALLEQDGQKLTHVGAALGIAPASITGLSDRMAARGLVRRQADPADRRAALLWLEPAGRALAERALPDVMAMNQRLLADVSAADQAVIARFLTHLATAAAPLIDEEDMT